MAADSPVVIISVVIPCYRRPELAVEAVRSALRQRFDPAMFEVIAVDSSPDDAVARALENLKSEAPCRLEIYRKEPEGPGPSRNLGAARSTGEYIAFLDSDCQATGGWLEALVAAFEGQIGIVQGRTLPIPSKPQGIFSHTLRVEKEGFLYETANIAYARAAFEKAGGFLADRDPRAATPLGGEDTDLAWRVRRMGWRTCFATEALVYHDILPMRKLDWIWIRRLKVFPGLIARYPELRQFCFCRYFLDRAQAFVVLGVAGAAVAPWFPLALLLLIPYVAFRASEPTRSLKGPLRLGRPVLYFIRDFSSLCILAASSVKNRRILL
jgi:glycosyltransferase involved in cell wall biosynthesis